VVFDSSIAVPGLSDNVALGVQRGRLRMTGAEVKEIFKPVLQVCFKSVLNRDVLTIDAGSGESRPWTDQSD